MEAKRTVTLPGYGDVLIEGQRTISNYYHVRIWLLHDGEPVDKIICVRKEWEVDIDSQPTCSKWQSAIVELSRIKLLAAQTDAYIALLKLAQEQAEALDREFVPGSEVAA